QDDAETTPHPHLTSGLPCITNAGGALPHRRQWGTTPSREKVRFLPLRRGRSHGTAKTRRAIMRRSPFMLLVAALLVGASSLAHAQCTTTDEAKDARRTAKQVAKCNDKA